MPAQSFWVVAFLGMNLKTSACKIPQMSRLLASCDQGGHASLDRQPAGGFPHKDVPHEDAQHKDAEAPFESIFRNR